jgi:hypothetical protein
VKKLVSKFAFRIQLCTATPWQPRVFELDINEGETVVALTRQRSGYTVGTVYKLNAVDPTHSLKVPGLVSSLDPIK